MALATPEDVLEKAAYTLANPVAAGLVPSAREWPGLWSGPDRIGTAIVAPRPNHFFDPKGQLPESATLELAAPPGYSSADEFREALCGALAEQEAAEREGKTFLGVSRVLAQLPTARPKPNEPRRGLNPRVGARDKWKRIEALGRLVEFLSAYREAWKARRAGKGRTVFPAGTYLLRVMHGVPCAACG